MEAVRALRAQGRPMRAIVVGDPALAELSGEEEFEARPWVERSVLYGELYPRADALVLPSRVEGFGLAPIEAMSFALPVIASR